MEKNQAEAVTYINMYSRMIEKISLDKMNGGFFNI